MTIKCVTDSCPEQGLTKSTDGIPAGEPVLCGECGKYCAWPDGSVPLLEPEPEPDPGAIVKQPSDPPLVPGGDYPEEQQA